MRKKLSALASNDVRISLHIRSLRSQWRQHVVWRWQRMQHGYSDRDLWSFDWYLADVMSKGIRQLADSKADYVPLTKDYEVDWDNGKSKHYTRMLNEMADGFAVMRECDGSPTEEQQKRIDRSWELLSRFHHVLWD